ncbi:LytR family transcriptional regulator, partial [Escherichia coli]
TEQGRSDTMMVVTVNPKQKKSTIISLDRDIYTNIVGYGTVDKLNHAYAFGGVEMAMDSIEQLLDIP